MFENAVQVTKGYKLTYFRGDREVCTECFEDTTALKCLLDMLAKDPRPYELLSLSNVDVIRTESKIREVCK